MVETKRKAAAVLAACLCLLSSRSWAQEETELEGWFELNTFKPASTPLDGLSIEKARVLGSFQPSVGAYLQFDDDPLTRQRETADGWEEATVEVERLVVLHFTGAVGLFDFAQIAAHFPIYLDKGRPNSSGGIGDLCLIPKGALRTDFDGGEAGLAVLVPVSLPLGDEKSFAGRGEVAVAPGLAGEVAYGRFSTSLNAAVAIQKESKGEIAPDHGKELLLGLGAEYDLGARRDQLRALAEIVLSTQFADPFSRAGTPIGVLGGLGYRFIAGISVTAAAGAGVSSGVGSPDFRALIGIGWVPPIKRVSSQPAAEKPTSDADLDGVVNMDDKCPNEPEDFDEFEDEDGCPDLDNDMDGIADTEDACPNEPETVNGADDEDGCPDEDADTDGISDIRDACPAEAEDLDQFEDEDGCPDEDNDNDGFPDEKDSCPTLPESAAGLGDRNGCPEYFKLEGNKIRFSARIGFIKGVARLKRSGQKVLEELAASIIANPLWEEVRISVHTLGEGDSEAEQLLSEVRAIAVMRSLASLGVVPERLIAVGKGSSEPLASPDTIDGKRRNERVEVEIKTGQAR